VFARDLEHAGGEIQAQDLFGAGTRQRDAVVAGAADVDDAAAFDGVTARQRFFVADEHCAAKQPIGNAVERPVVIAVDGIEIDRIAIEELRRTLAHCITLCERYWSNEVTESRAGCV
jgi:hypothetical protein